ncbi:transposase InsO family protein [Agrobacterium tumefaciens]|uniref:Transposase InsO family protein n=1 Tax=Agrobacterium tumefaciens TaxID=358 RepID=A0AAW8M1Z9_AGRTU|nr:transposase InsO family protein [Agrobacterium tumefaciens]MDR6705321.1 transposase InsO family protein [Agrobacterium tumefaciens]TCV46323.1 hypothetical protein EDB97_11641 [Agrobacterium tumefaciens]
MAGGFVYLCAVVDWFSRKVLPWQLSITMEATFCIEAVEEALACYAALKKSEVAISMDGKGA